MYNPQQRAVIRSDIAWSKLLHSYSLSEAISGLATESRRGTAAEVHQELSRHQMATQSNSILVPWAVLARANTVAVALSGGYLVQTENLTAADALRPRMVCGALGQTIITAPHGSNVTLPRQTGAGTAYWLSSETATATEAEQTFGQVAFSPRTVGAYTELSRLLKLQSTEADSIIARDLAAVLARAVDRGQLAGTGASGTLQGIENVAGVQAFNATDTSLWTLLAAQTSLGDAIGPSTGLATTLNVAGSLRGRHEFEGSSATLWQGGLVAGTAAGMPARSSTAIDANTLVIGTWEFLNLIIWGDLEISVNPYAGFRAGTLGIRAFMSCDSAVTWPAAFSVATDFS
jgi:HK97 family phage major capsid protein